MDNFSALLSKWFSERPKWLQAAAICLLEKNELSKQEISNIVSLCQQEAEGKLVETNFSFPVTAFSQNITNSFRLCSIKNIEGVNALAPKKPLEFGKSNITVVYGDNASGKSGYVRLIKHICGVRNPGALHHNVYAALSSGQKASITYEKDEKAKTYEWTGQDICDDLKSVNIFDTSVGKIFVRIEDEVSYEPPVLSFFSSLIDICEKVAEVLDFEVKQHPSKKPNMPVRLKETPEGIWYENISSKTTLEDIKKHCSFEDKDETEVQSLQRRLVEQTPSEKAARYRKEKSHVDSLIQDAQRYLEQLSDENCRRIIVVKKKLVLKKAVATAAAEKVFSGSQLEGIGSDVWKELWEAARNYSVTAAYKGIKYPNISEDSRCVLCHQILSQETKEKFFLFEDFVKDEIQKSVIEVAKEYETAIEKIENIPNPDMLNTIMDAAGIPEDEIRGYGLYLMSTFDSNKCNEIKENTVVLTNENTAYFIINGNLAIKDDKPQIVKISDRQGIAQCNPDEFKKIESPKDAVDKIIQESTLKSDHTQIRRQITEFFLKLQTRKNQLPNLESEQAIPVSLQSPKWIEFAKALSKKLEKLTEKYEADAKTDNRDQIKKSLNSLLAHKWLTENCTEIHEEINRLNFLSKIHDAKKTTNTHALSQKKGELAEALITDDFVQRFNTELKVLGASKVKVELVKSKVSKGRVLHKLQLRRAFHNNPLEHVLSEGENRIVSIAAFLADVTGKTTPSPFIFDDPISSLDQIFEEAVVQRLCSLSVSRQIIIFTHRLSLLSLIQDYAKKVNCEPDIVCIREESWGTGEPGDTPLFAKKPDKALNSLINDRLPKLRKLLNEDGRESYEIYAKALCSDFRILLERMIECELLADIVQRHRRGINTMGKIDKLSKITERDCTYFDNLMTKYSRYEHSQSLESPVLSPEPDELESDFNILKQWHDEFKNRPVGRAAQ